MSVGKEWEIPLRHTQKFCPENCFRCDSTKNAYTEKSLFAQHGPFFQVLSHIMSCKYYCIDETMIIVTKKVNKRICQGYSVPLLLLILYQMSLSADNFLFQITRMTEWD